MIEQNALYRQKMMTYLLQLFLILFHQLRVNVSFSRGKGRSRYEV
jgi:hypothetical protein